MDPSHSREDMSPLYVLRKKKCVKSQSKSGNSCPGNQTASFHTCIFFPFYVNLVSPAASKRMPQRTGELNSVGLFKVRMNLFTEYAVMLMWKWPVRGIIYFCPAEGWASIPRASKDEKTLRQKKVRNTWLAADRLFRWETSRIHRITLKQ